MKDTSQQIEKAVVLFNQGKDVVLRLSCSPNGGCRECGACGSSAKEASRQLSLDTATHPKLRETSQGDVVELKVSLPNPAVAALLLFGIPLFLIAAAAGGAHLIFSSGERLTIIAGIGGFFFSIIPIKFANRHLTKSGYGYRVISVEPEKAKEC